MKIFGWESKGWSSKNEKDNSVVPRNPDRLVILAIQTKLFKQLPEILSYVHKLTHSRTANRSPTYRTVLEKSFLRAAAAQDPTWCLPTKQAPPTPTTWPRCRDREERPNCQRELGRSMPKCRAHLASSCRNGHSGEPQTISGEKKGEDRFGRLGHPDWICQQEEDLHDSNAKR